MIKSLLAVSLETVINRFLALDPQTMKSLQNFIGKVIRIEIMGTTDKATQFGLNFLITERGIQLTSNSTIVPDTVIRGTASALLQQLKETSASNINIEGDVELGQQMRQLLRSMDIDWEEQLAKITGDVMAHQVGNITRKFADWSKDTVTHLQEDLTAYFQDEARYLPTRFEMEEFITTVDEVRHAAARLEARWHRYLRSAGVSSV